TRFSEERLTNDGKRSPPGAAFKWILEAGANRGGDLLHARRQNPDAVVGVFRNGNIFTFTVPSGLRLFYAKWITVTGYGVGITHGLAAVTKSWKVRAELTGGVVVKLTGGSN